MSNVKLNKKPVTGMKDILPQEMRIREYVQSVISDTYAGFGFTRIETPCVESIGNLTSKQGGDNEKLIFKILKRGEKLRLEEASSEEDLVDGGLRYDLTVPLVRFYANNSANLPSPFKALQMGNVWRADRPQRGRYRQFMQCDIDILGEPSDLAEIELILATTEALGKLEFRNFEIRINERRILKAMAAYAGFAEDRYDQVFITLDKMDKIGPGGVRAELIESGEDEAKVDRYLELFKGIEASADGAEGAAGTDGAAGNKGAEGATAGAEQNDPVAQVRFIADTLGEYLDGAIAENLSEIITTVENAKKADFKIVFDPTLVRGMSYYTGTIFEIAMPEYGGSCGGGGRYDEMVGKFTGQNVPACGFSIGFERIIMLLMERGFTVPGEREKKAYLVEKGIGADRLSEIIAKAQDERAAGRQVLVVRMNKNKKFQKEQLEAEGYHDFEDFYRDSLQS